MKEVKVNYKNSGVKTLRGIGKFFMVVGCIASAIAIISFVEFVVNDSDHYGSTGLVSTFFMLALFSFAAGAICLGLSGIAKTALYNRALLEQQYEFEEVTSTSPRKFEEVTPTSVEPLAKATDNSIGIDDYIDRIEEPLLKKLMFGNRIDEAQASDLFHNSKTFTRLADKSTELYLRPWQEIYEMLKKELSL
jgi:hypothetical protein